jgi:hypothetical protein
MWLKFFPRPSEKSFLLMQRGQRVNAAIGKQLLLTNEVSENILLENYVFY